MRTPSALPGELGDVFDVRTAAAMRVGRDRLGRSDVIAPFRGSRVRLDSHNGRAIAARGTSGRTVSPADVERAALARARAYAPVMPGHAFFIGSTAALIGGVPLPPDVHGELHVGVMAPRTAPRRPGVRGRQLSHGASQTYRGLRVADIATTWATLGAHLGEYDLVAAADYLVHEPRTAGNFHNPDRLEALVTIEQLEATLAAGPWKGARTLRRALERCRTGAASRPETWLRLILVDHGLPEPVLDHDIWDDSGRFIACADQAYPELRISLDYEGDGHREKAQFEHDINRFARLAEAGWYPLRFTREHVFRRPEVAVARTRAALASRGGAEARPRGASPNAPCHAGRALSARICAVVEV